MDVKREESGQWEFEIEGLPVATTTLVEVAAINDVGRGPKGRLRVHTSEPPRVPWIDQTDGTPSSITVTWEIGDPEGAAVTECTVALDGVARESVLRQHGWSATFTGLQPSRKYQITVAARNAAGVGNTKQHFVYTSRFERASGQTYTMYHGTSASNAQSIRRSGFRPSTVGMLGPGVYLSRDKRKAQAYAKAHGDVILTCRVSVGKVKCINRQGHPLQQTWHQHGYDSAWVPPNCGMVASGLEEDCVWDPQRIQILS